MMSVSKCCVGSRHDNGKEFHRPIATGLDRAIAKLDLSVCLSVYHTRDPCLDGLSYRNTFYTHDREMLLVS